MSRKALIGIGIAVTAVLITLVALRRGPEPTVADNPSVKRTVLEDPKLKKSAGSALASASRPTPPPSPRPTRQSSRDRGRRERSTTGTRTLSGRVTLPDGTPLAGAQVTANFGTSTTTDATGHYELANLPAQIWGVNASHNDTITSTVRRISSDQTTLDFVLRRKTEIVFIGKVFESVSRKPVSDFTIAMEDHEVTSSPATPGRFEIRKVFTGDRISFRLESPNTLPRDVQEWIPTDATGTIEREYALGAGGTIKGRVVRGTDKKPVSGVHVALGSFGGFGRGGPGGGGSDSRRRGRSSAQTSATTDADGKFALEEVRPGPVILQLSPEKPLMAAMKFAGEMQYSEVKDVGNLEVGEGGVIKGRVVKVPVNRGIPGVLVELSSFGGGGGAGGNDNSGSSDNTTSDSQDTGRGGRRGFGGFGGRGGDNNTTSVVADAKGEFTFTRVTPGPHTLSVRDLRVRESVTLNADETRQVALRVGSGILKGTIVKDSLPVTAEVNLFRQSGGGFTAGFFGGGRGLTQTNTHDDGTFEMKDLTPGKWQIYVTPENARPGLFDVDIPNEGVLEKTFPLPSGDVVGRVVDAEDKPVAGALVSVLASGDSIFGTGGMIGGFSGFGGFGGGGGQDGGRGGRGGFGGGNFGGRGNSSIQTGDDGTFRLEDRAPGMITIMAQKDGLGYSESIQAQVPELGDSDDVVIKIGAVPTGNLVSTVLNLETQGPIPNAYLNLTNDKGRFNHGQRRGEDGVLTITKLPVGSYKTEAGAMGYTTSQQTVEIKANETAQITDVLSPGGSLRWTVVDTTGAGIPKANCTLTPQDPASIETPRTGVTSDSGVWFIRGVLPGAYTVSCTTTDGKTASAQVNIPSGSFAQETTVVP